MQYQAWPLNIYFSEYPKLQGFLVTAEALLRQLGLCLIADSASFSGGEKRGREGQNICQPNVTSKNSTQSHTSADT